jgi:superfamily II DNA or RNA helicase
MKPYKDQEKSIDKIMNAFKIMQRLLFCLATGGGKTACFSFVAKRFIKEYNQKVLVLAHRDELIHQTLATLRTIDVSCESVVANKKKLHHNSNVYVAMVQTLKNRLRNDNDFLKDVGLIIIDEAHLLMHEEIFEYYPNAKILAVTATPVTLKKIYFSKCSVCSKEYPEVVECCNYETYEYSKKFSLSEIYEDIIIGTSISELINSERLVRELVYCTGSIDRSTLKIDNKTGDFDSKSSDEYYGANSFDVVKNYEEIAKGKKTIIFNSSSKINALVLEAFKEKGYENIKLFDSVNETENRKKVLQWFKETPDAILLNVNCFTTGFDEPTLECVILNRATKSLSLYHQMVGRGGRKCDEIYKPYFTLIDGGGNVEEFGKWSDEVDWETIFYGTDEKPKPKKEALDQTKQCPDCGMIHAKNEAQCPECKYLYIDPEKKIYVSGEVAKLIDEIPKPNGSKIVSYVQKIGRDKNFAWLILQNQIIDLFIFHSVTFGSFLQAEKNGKFDLSMRALIKEPYQTIQNSYLESGTMRTKAYIINKIKSKLNDYYSRKQNSTGRV